MARCGFIKASGERCKGTATGQNGLCWAHAPENADQRRRMASRAARSKPNRELRDVKALCEDLTERVLVGDLLPGPTPKARTRKPRGPGGASGGDSRMDAGTVLHWPVQVVQVVQQLETGETV